MKLERGNVDKSIIVTINNSLKFTDRATTVRKHKRRYRLYKLYDEMTYNTSDSFNDFCFAAKAIFIITKLRRALI